MITKELRDKDGSECYGVFSGEELLFASESPYVAHATQMLLETPSWEHHLNSMTWVTDSEKEKIRKFLLG